jgi:drug/metabolite transporter (DMT)-like permease
MDRPMTPKAWIALSLVYVVWGSTYLAIRVVVRTLPPLLSAGARWVVAGLILLTFSWPRGAQALRPTRRHWINATIIGCALLLGGNGLVSIAERRISSGMAALLVATVPLFIALFELAVYRVRPRPVVVAGIIIGFAGTAVLVQPGADVDMIGALAIMGATSTWAAGSLFARRADLPSRPILSTGMQMITGGIVIVIVGTIGGEWARLDLGAVSSESWTALAYLALVGSLVGFSSYAWLIRNAKTSIVATYAYVNPLVAVILGALILDEKITSTTALGGGIIIVAVAMIVASGTREARTVVDAAEPSGAR